MATELTKRQKSVLLQIAEGIRNHGYPPTFREIGQVEGIRSTNGVRCILEALEKKGYIIRHRYQSRAIEFTSLAHKILKEDSIELYEKPESDDTGYSIELNETISNNSRLIEIPILGRVAAGEPLLAEQNIDSHIAIDADYAPRGDTFALRVKGSSMINAGIHDGDVVFCRVQEYAETGETIVALIDDEATVKYYYPEKHRVVLKPDNPDFAAIIVEPERNEFRVLGKVVGLYRKYI